MQLELPNEREVNQAIAERARELRALRSIARALERYRRESQGAAETRKRIMRGAEPCKS
ncbi:MAG: hypothetical protein NXI32_11495 [bacterium]|nr:hypothetical protein [bacterium]